MWLESFIAVAVPQTGGHTSDVIRSLAWESLYAMAAALKRPKKKKKKMKTSLKIIREVMKNMPVEYNKKTIQCLG